MAETFGSDDPRALTQEERLTLASDWSDYRSNYGASGAHDHATFEGGWMARNELAHRAADAAEMQWSARESESEDRDADEGEKNDGMMETSAEEWNDDVIFDRLEELDKQRDRIEAEEIRLSRIVARRTMARGRALREQLRRENGWH